MKCEGLTSDVPNVREMLQGKKYNVAELIIKKTRQIHMDR